MCNCGGSRRPEGEPSRLAQPCRAHGAIKARHYQLAHTSLQEDTSTCSVTIFLPFTHQLLVRAEQMVFGRPKRVGMAKTKKKVKVLETYSATEVDMVTLKIDSEPSNRGREPQGAVGARSRGHRDVGA